MKTQTHVQISTPCNEDWNKMSNSEKGRFCESCASQVIDFTAMTDQQVLAYLAVANGKVCGRFNEDQLNRTLYSTEIGRKKMWQWAVASFTSLFFLASKSQAQTKANKQVPQAAALLNGSRLDDGKALNGILTIKGQVMDDARMLLANASVIDPQNLNRVLTNRNGNFVMQVDAATESVLVQAHGYDARVVPVSMLNSKDTSITLIKADTTNPGLDKFDKTAFEGTVIMGGITTFDKREHVDTVVTFVKKIFNNAFFKIQPNPTIKGNVGISVKQAGTYTVQIFDNSSKLVHTAEIAINAKGEIVYVSLPTCVTKGTYYIRLIDKQTKKEYVDKMVVAG